MTAPANAITIPPGNVCITTYGTIQHETTQALMELRSYTEAQNVRPIWSYIPGSLVDRARNQAVVQFLQHQPALGWLLFIDGDAVFKPDALCQLLAFAYGNMADHIDALGAYCTLRGDPYLPTIDTGTGTWESWLPGHGPMEVMRTGSAFVLMKRQCFEKVEGPWYGTRHPWRPIDALMEVDNFAHTRFDGRNPLADLPEWQTLVRCAKDDPSVRQRQDPAAFVGEDSNWCDRLRFAGLHVWVQTDVEVQHVDKVVRSGADHRICMENRRKLMEQLVGVIG